MPITLNDTPQAGFDEPLRLMSDCHRRVERFLGVLVRLAHENAGGPLDEPRRGALEAALRYFQSAAPWHTQDEEASLFPRLRRCSDPRALFALRQVRVLERDHRDAGPLHEGADALGRRWLDAGVLSDADAALLRGHVDRLAATYQRHIAVEDSVVFPVANAVLTDAALQAIGREMADRRGIDPQLPPRRCRHGLHRSLTTPTAKESL